jgi:NAD(P)-dependent dehydrogenase (short-subunit alcohol dehydrogenase family)
MNVTSLKGRIVMITGATSGLGAACAVDLAIRGAHVAVTGRNSETGEAVADNICRQGFLARFFPLDVTDAKAWPLALSSIQANMGHPSAILSNAGECVLGPLQDMNVETMRFLVDINTRSNFLALKYGVPAIRRAGGGNFIAITSVAAIKPAPGGAAYAMSKAAIHDLIRLAARENAGCHPVVQINTVAPGLIWTPGVVDTLGAERAAQMYDRVVAGTPLARPATISDILSGIRYLLNHTSAAISGIDLKIDGGFTA